MLGVPASRVTGEPPWSASDEVAVTAIPFGDIVSQPSTFIKVRSDCVIQSIWPEELNARNESAPALPAQSPRSPFELVFQESRFVVPLLIEKYAGPPVP